jgi:hypothetical protein
LENLKPASCNWTIQLRSDPDKLSFIDSFYASFCIFIWFPRNVR